MRKVKPVKKRYLVGLAVCFILTGCAGTGYPIEPATQFNTQENAEQEADQYAVQNTGDLFVIQNGNSPYFTDKDKERALTEVWEEYSALDELGRCGIAYANLCTELRPTEERGEIGQIKPTGWHTVKYSGIVDGNYLYNRCHLIAFMLAGENDNPLNLITGTRYFNVNGMLTYEDLTNDYMDTHPDYHVLYRVTPIFDEDNLVADGVLMEAYSVEDEGELSFCVFVNNIQPGITIDYKTGESWLNNEDAVSEDQDDQTADSEKMYVNYVLNTSSKKYHMPDCSAVEKISVQNKETYNGTLDWLIENGYEPCRLCNPD